MGKGRNIWNNVHVEDLADFYVLLLEKAIAGEASSGKEGGWYFAENGEHSFHVSCSVVRSVDRQIVLGVRQSGV